ncbi:MAG: hypothetical protein SGJ27_26955 [Candidatus Melainabacteria bacterium]|nr:hypothetical protein [Candidatus Melainabacteria bacterium]
MLQFTIFDLARGQATPDTLQKDCEQNAVSIALVPIDTVVSLGTASSGALEAFIGPCSVIEMFEENNKNVIDADEMKAALAGLSKEIERVKREYSESVEAPTKLLIKTRDTKTSSTVSSSVLKAASSSDASTSDASFSAPSPRSSPSSSRTSQNARHLSPAALAVIVEHGITLVGVDSTELDPADSKDNVEYARKNKLPCLINLELSEVESGFQYILVAPPMVMKDRDLVAVRPILLMN